MDILNNIWLTLTVLAFFTQGAIKLSISDYIRIPDEDIDELIIIGDSLLCVWMAYTPIYLIIRIWS